MIKYVVAICLRENEIFGHILTIEFPPSILMVVLSVTAFIVVHTTQTTPTCVTITPTTMTTTSTRTTTSKTTTTTTATTTYSTTTSTNTTSTTRLSETEPINQRELLLAHQVKN